MDENTMAKFEEKLTSVIAMGKKKKNALDFQEIVNQFAEFNLEEEQYDKIVETLEQKERIQNGLLTILIILNL